MANTFVKTMTSSDFEKEFAQNDQLKQCVVEIFKKSCPACEQNKPVFNIFSRKLHKHGYGDELPLYRILIDNAVPSLGNFGYSPIYMHVSKDPATGKIKTIKTLEPPFKAEAFLREIGELSGLPGLEERV